MFLYLPLRPAGRPGGGSCTDFAQRQGGQRHEFQQKRQLGGRSQGSCRHLSPAFFSLSPDDKVIKEHITKSLYLADQSAKHAYDNLEEKGYYAGLIAGNISQSLQVDSVKIDTRSYPYPFRCYATQQIIRQTGQLRRTLITSGYLREVIRSDNNPHGFLIERWNTLENKDLKTTQP
ncbi:conjugative transposon protein TraK [Pedobacter panaciterrae]